MNKATKQLYHLRTFFHPSYLHHEYYYVDRLQGTISQYIWNKVQIKIVPLSTLRHILHIKLAPQEDERDCFVVDNHNYRVLTLKDDIAIHQLYQSYFLFSHEIGMHLFLLFHSKYGSKFLSKQLNVPVKIISEIRHNKKSYKDLPIDTILSIENFYLNSELEKHILRQKINITVNNSNPI